MSIPREFIDLLLTKIDIVDLIHTYCPLQKKSGANYFARCPFHNEKSASFSVSQTKQFYYCFGCGAHGNAIDFMMQHERLSFPEAIETLARQTAMELPETTGFTKKTDFLVGLYEQMKVVATHYYEQMRQSTRAIDYLKNRGISGTIAQLFQIGYAPLGWHHLLEHFNKSDSDKKKLLDTGLIIKKEDGSYYDRFRDRIMFPIHDYRGRIIGFGGRILDQGEPKYLNSPETILFQKGHELYGLYQALKSQRTLDRLLVVEGYMDVIALFQHEIHYAVATLGTATTSHHLQKLFRYTSEVVFCFDGDQAGRLAAWRAVSVIMPLMKDHLQIRFLFLPDHEDPDSLIRKEGKVKFENRITAAQSLATFFFHTLSQDCDLNTIEGRARYATTALQSIKQLTAEIYQGMMVEELSKRARINIIELKKQIKSQEPIKLQNNALTPLEEKSKLPTAARLAITLLLQQPKLITFIKEPIPPCETGWSKFLSELIHKIQLNPDITTGALLEYWRGEKEEQFLAKLVNWEHLTPDSGLESEFKGAMRQLTLLSFDQEINRLLAKATEATITEDEKIQLSQYINKKKRLAQEI